jgi:DNA invertase Pin-like site-specific DNA recombinase
MKIVAYYRVSTKKQATRKGKTGKYTSAGLGLQAQKKIVSDFAANNKAKIIAEYTEVETGKTADRPQLQQAIDHARLNKATLVIAKLDRLSRNVHFTSGLLESGVEFFACDLPHANKFTIHVMAALAEQEARAISQRTKDALAMAKREGVKLGSAREGHWEGREDKRGWKKGAKVAAKLRSERAQAAYGFLMNKLTDMRDNEKLSYDDMAKKLNDLGHSTTAGKPFTAVAVWRIMNRKKDKASKARRLAQAS